MLIQHKNIKKKIVFLAFSSFFCFFTHMNISRINNINNNTHAHRNNTNAHRNNTNAHGHNHGHDVHGHNRGYEEHGHNRGYDAHGHNHGHEGHRGHSNVQNTPLANLNAASWTPIAQHSYTISHAITQAHQCAITSHYNRERLHYSQIDQMVFVLSGNQEKEWGEMTINERLEVANSQFGHLKNRQTIIGLLSTAKLKDKHNGRSAINGNSNWCKELNNQINKALSEHVFCGSYEKYSGIHGPKHATRAMMNVLFYVSFLKNAKGITVDDDTITVAAIAALFHDSGRQAEGEDVADELSALNAYNYCMSHGLTGLAIRCRNAISHKDDDPIRNNNKSIEAKLLQAADCIEIQRCRSNFDVHCIDFVKTGEITPAEGNALAKIGKDFMDANGTCDEQKAYTNHYTSRTYNSMSTINLARNAARGAGMSW
ncbi:MAG: hypothetical protein LBI61_01835 [Puniceicoccales bacterium]|jgi:hypothetical protein|nr:hypothetical protein [Puniceicoccales bacterium]